MSDIFNYLAANSYPGRGIIAGQKDGKTVIAYFIMGRSANSRNRIFVKDDDRLYTKAFDESKVADPSLIIYNAIREIDGNIIVTNGDQTDTVYEYLKQGKNFKEALDTREYEPDEPNYTPRISALINENKLELAILKRENNECVRLYHTYDLKDNTGYFISTYDHDGNPLPSFSRDPIPFEITDSFSDFAFKLWRSLNNQNKISLYVKMGKDEIIFNKNEDNNMNELLLKYGCNPNQKPSRIFMADGSELPVKVLNGRPGYINFLDALNSWQLVKELKEATGITCAASFKHVSPTSAALGLKLSDTLKKACFVDDVKDLDDSPLACAYARARGTDRLSSYGDFAALSDICDATTARLIRREVSDGVIAPGYTSEALEILKQKKKGAYNIIQIDPDYNCAPIENKQVFGITFQQGHNDIKITPDLFNEIVTDNKELPQEAVRDLIVALITLKYTQSNSVAYAYDGQAIGVGAGQQSRIHCTRLAGSKADTWFLRQHEKVLNLPFKKTLSRNDRDNVIDGYINNNEEDVTADGNWQKYFTSQPEPLTEAEKKEYLSSINDVSLGSDAFFPFGDNIERAHRSGVRYVAQPGGSIRDDNVIATCNKYGMVMCFNHIRLFHH